MTPTGFTFISDHESNGCLEVGEKKTCDKENVAFQLVRPVMQNGLLRNDHMFHRIRSKEEMTHRSESALGINELNSVPSRGRRKKRIQPLIETSASRGRWGLEAQAARGIAQGMERVADFVSKTVRRLLSTTE